MDKVKNKQTKSVCFGVIKGSGGAVAYTYVVLRKDSLLVVVFNAVVVIDGAVVLYAGVVLWYMLMWY